jgi:hypothetical protein
LYQTAVLGWCDDKQMAYAISAGMSEQLRAEILRLPEAAWQVERDESDAIRSWTQVPYVPSDGDYRKIQP